MSGLRSTVPYGFWESDWTAAKAACASRDFAELRAGHGGLLWIQYDPEDARCTLWFWREGEKLRCLTPPGISVRSRVYEYGGGAFCLTGSGVAYVDEQDQQIHLQSLKEGCTPVALTHYADCRYGDLHFDALHAAILAVEERRSEGGVEHRLVSIALKDGQRRVLIEGADFYASPVLDCTTNRLAWIQWQRPHQPWTQTSLWVAERAKDGTCLMPRCIAGESGGESLQQPRFAPDGTLYCLSDRNGWWQPWQEQAGCLVPVEGSGTCDHAPAPWQLGTMSHVPLGEGKLLLTRMLNGYGLLFEQNANEARALAADYSRCRQLAADAANFYCIAASPWCTSAVVAIDRVSGQCRVLAGGEQSLPSEHISLPEPLSFATAGGEAAHGFFYAPLNADYDGPETERPPLVVFVHGGPTSATYPVFDPRIQYWTQRGFAVADINYRGSSGYGRAYRQRLHRQWGILDVEDVIFAVKALAEAGRIDPARTFVRGSSAGGYTTLCALIADAGFRGGASLYGVSDPLSLRRVTHKFEGDYLDWLIGDPTADHEVYQQRTPLLHAARIQVPVIFFQGGLDAVVLPEQTESMVTALRDQGIEVEYHLYPQERHGFRQANHLADALEREFRFYQKLLAD